MKTFIVEIKDESKAVFVETLLSQLDGVVYEEKVAIKKKKAAKKKPVLFEKSFGMWADTDITLESIRAKAWPKRKSI